MNLFSSVFFSPPWYFQRYCCIVRRLMQPLFLGLLLRYYHPMKIPYIPVHSVSVPVLRSDSSDMPVTNEEGDIATPLSPPEIPFEIFDLHLII